MHLTPQAIVQLIPKALGWAFIITILFGIGYLAGIILLAFGDWMRGLW